MRLRCVPIPHVITLDDTVVQVLQPDVGVEIASDRKVVRMLGTIGALVHTDRHEPVSPLKFVFGSNVIFRMAVVLPNPGLLELNR